MGASRATISQSTAGPKSLCMDETLRDCKLFTAAGLDRFMFATRAAMESGSLSSVASRAGTPVGSTGLVQRAQRIPAGERRSKSFETQCVSISSDTPAKTTSDLPLKAIPGNYGLPFFGAIKDKWDFYWFEGTPGFYESRRDKYKSTVFRTNVAPGPPGFPDPRVIMLLDEKSFPILFDVSKVEKKDVFTGTYIPSLNFTGGYRVLPYVDPSEPKHAALKGFCFEMLKNSGRRIVPSLQGAVQEAFSQWESTLAKDGKVNPATALSPATFKFNLTAFVGRDPLQPGESDLRGFWGVKGTKLWQLPQLAPIAIIPSPPLPKLLIPLVELLLHTFPIPSFLVRPFYQKLVNFFQLYGKEVLDMGEQKFGLAREEALHNLIFFTVFNSWGGIEFFWPTLLKRLGGTSAEFQAELAAEVRNAIKSNGGQLSPAALANMPTVVSTIYEALRIDPPVPFQYARAKEDLVIESHEARFQVKKGEMLAGYMPTTTKDPNVFDEPSTFLPKRFMGEAGHALLRYVLWSNGPQTEEPTLENKHCAGKNFVLTVSQLFVAELYTRYDYIKFDAGSITSLKRASS